MQAKLLKRTPKGVELTIEGSALLAHIRKIRRGRHFLNPLAANQ